ncbi:hypothetical protein HA48_14825 [Pantoea wallisii]|uniref:Uncharacterized protein n=1 Tax=Pantoea wallisii TaxID=1076551 RepID=A0A1X1D6P1_9GAMM|nr:hypothetical protein HA48_14825 [Pantoea wallisii]
MTLYIYAHRVTFAVFNCRVRIYAHLARRGVLAARPGARASKGPPDRKGTRHPADRPRHPWRGRFALRAGLRWSSGMAMAVNMPAFGYWLRMV